MVFTTADQPGGRQGHDVSPATDQLADNARIAVRASAEFDLRKAREKRLAEARARGVCPVCGEALDADAPGRPCPCAPTPRWA